MLLPENPDYDPIVIGEDDDVHNHEKIIFIERKKLTLPPEADGAIKVLENGSLEWIAHKKLTNVEAEINQNGLHSIAKSSVDSWRGAFKFKAEQPEENGEILPGNEGLRPPQLGGLYSIGSHWSLKHKPATIIMPTGTSKTETMLSALIIDLLSRPDGATLAEIISATEWKSYSVRGHLSNLRKKQGINIESFTNQTGISAYVIAAKSEKVSQVSQQS